MFASSRLIMISLLLVGLVCGASVFAQSESEASANYMVYRVKPSQTDAAIKHFDESHLVTFNRKVDANAQLAVFLPGTDGKPGNAPLILRVIAEQGYRVIGLEYNDEPAVVQVCPRHPSPKCSGEFREKRVFGDDVTSVVDNTPAESIVNRLTKLLQYLDQQHPDEHWDHYLSDGAPEWSRIVVSGLSQGAGMAAYIAKKKSVARVVLFSSPWDYYGRSKELAPWISESSATPSDRWYAAYHRRENTAELIAHSYRTLSIPKDHVRAFNLDLPRNYKGKSDNPFHGSTIRNSEYISDWQFLFGHAE